MDLRDLFLETPLGVEIELGVHVLVGHHLLAHDPAMAQKTALSFLSGGLSDPLSNLVNFADLLRGENPFVCGVSDGSAPSPIWVRAAWIA